MQSKTEIELELKNQKLLEDLQKELVGDLTNLEDELKGFEDFL